MGGSGQLLGEAYVKISLDDLKKLDLKVDDSGRKFNAGFDKMQTKANSLTKALGAFGGVIAGIGVAKFGSDIIGAATRMDSLNMALTRIEGSGAKAKARLDEFRKIAKDPGLELGSLAKGYIQLRAVNLEADKSIKFLRGVGNEIAKIGGSEADLERVTRQFVQMQGKGRLLQEDLTVIAESMPSVRNLMQSAFGTTNIEAFTKAGGTAKTFFEGLTEAMAKTDKAIGGAQNAQTNFKSAIEQFNASLGANILPTFTKLIESLTNLMDKFGELPEGTKKALGTAVIGGAGLLGLSATLLSIASTIGIIKTGLSGLGMANAVNAGSAIATAGATATTTKLLNQYGRPYVLEGASAGAGAVAGGAVGSIAMKVATVSIIAGAAYLAYKAGAEIMKSPPAGAGAERMRMGGTDFGFGQMSYEEIAKYNKTWVESHKSGGAGRTWDEPVKKGGWNVPPDWKVGEFGERLSLQQMYGSLDKRVNSEVWDVNKPSMAVSGGLVYAPTAGKKFMPVYLTDDQLRTLKGLTTETFNIPEMFQEEAYYPGKTGMVKTAGGVFDWKEIQAGARAWSDRFNESATEMGRVQDSWNDLVDDMGYGIERVSYKWSEAISDTLSGLAQGFDLIVPYLEALGMDKSTSAKAGGILSGAISGAAVGSAFGPWGTAIGALVGAGSGYLKSHDSGGWITEPTIGIGMRTGQVSTYAENNAELVVNPRRGGLMGGTNIQSVNITFTHPNVRKQDIVNIFKELRAEGNI